MPTLQNAITFGSPRLKQRYIKQNKKGLQEVILCVENITCSGCIAKLEIRIRGIPGIHSVQINPSTHRGFIAWDEKVLSVEELLETFTDLGHPASPYETRQQEDHSEKERKYALIRIALAAALGMQVMMIATALYFGEAYGIEERYRSLLRIAAMILTVPVMVFCAMPFFKKAWRNIRNFTVGVDVPVSLALLVAFAGSVAATFGNSGQIYYESVVMFVFLLLFARYLEIATRQKSLAAVSQLEKSIPDRALRIGAGGETSHVDILELAVNDHILVGPGEIIPADGIIIDGQTTVDESILTGESRPIHKKSEETVVAGSVNMENELTVMVTRLAHDNVLSRIVHLTEKAQSAKPGSALIADRIAGKFVLGVLLVTLFAGCYWWFKNPSYVLPVVISTLVIACPCALSLATPTAFVAAMSALTRKGVIPIRGEFLEDVCHINHIVFDKTGTLTKGKLKLNAVYTAQGWSDAKAIETAAALNRSSKHPFARAFRNLTTDKSLKAEDVQHTLGGGVSGRIKGERFFIGSLDYVHAQVDGAVSHQPRGQLSQNQSTCYLADKGAIVARFTFSDTLRNEARDVIHQLQQQGLAITLLSGDHESVVSHTANALGITDYQFRLSPAEKQQFVQHLQRQGNRVAVVGDGLNDAPVLASADVSLAMGQGADLTKINADVVLLNNRLSDMLDILDCSRRTRKIIRQNLIWAIGYNLLALPAAVSGLIPPWLAAIGMSASSLIVSTNAMRLLHARVPRKQANRPGANMEIQYA